jgi:hypothetical protein
MQIRSDFIDAWASGAALSARYCKKALAQQRFEVTRVNR